MATAVNFIGSGFDERPYLVYRLSATTDGEIQEAIASICQKAPGATSAASSANDQGVVVAQVHIPSVDGSTPGVEEVNEWVNPRKAPNNENRSKRTPASTASDAGPAAE